MTLLWRLEASIRLKMIQVGWKRDYVLKNELRVFYWENRSLDIQNGNLTGCGQGTINYTKLTIL